MKKLGGGIVHLKSHACFFLLLFTYNSPVLQSARPRAVDSGEAKMRTASWENVDKQVKRMIRNNT